MINNVIGLHFKMIQNRFAASLLLIAVGAAMSIYSAYLFIALLVVSAILFLSGFNHIVRTSLVGDDGEIMMTLPVSAYEMVTGKIAVVVIWSISITFAMLAPMIAILTIKNGFEDTYMQIAESIMKPYFAAGISPAEGGIIACISGLETPLIPAIYCVICILVQIGTGSRNKKSGSFSIIKLIIGYAVAILLIFMLTKSSSYMIDAGLNPVITTAAHLILEVVIFYLIYKRCIFKLENNYDLIG